MKPSRSPVLRVVEKGNESRDTVPVAPRELVAKARALGHEALVQSISHALQFVDEPEEAVRSLIYQIQYHATHDPMHGENEPPVAATGS